MVDVILINPSYYKDIFGGSKAKSAISRSTISLGLACIAAPLIEQGLRVKLIDLNLTEHPDDYLKQTISECRPRVVGITSTTPLIKNIYDLAHIIKGINKEILIVAGGPHPSALPEEVLKESKVDCVVKGEGDFLFTMLVKRGISEDIPNITYKEGQEIISSFVQEDFIKDLDALPFPAYDLFDIKRYSQPLISSRRTPVGYLETSRGCYGRCIFCNKNIHGFKMRMKSPLRVVDEMERMLEIGFGELQIIDDIFTADMKRAYTICEEILRRRLKFPWYPRGGIRVDRVNEGLLKIMKRAGCYRIPFGIESGSQRIIDLIDKKITLEQAQEAVKLAKKVGLETECYFMLGLPTEKEEDIKKSIDFSIKLDPDYAKFAITMPLPGTKMFDEMESRKQIKTKDWNRYNFSSSPKDIYDHDTLSWKTIERYYDISHRKFYFRLNYVFKMMAKTFINGTLFAHIKAFLKTRW